MSTELCNLSLYLSCPWSNIFIWGIDLKTTNSVLKQTLSLLLQSRLILRLHRENAGGKQRRAFPSAKKPNPAFSFLRKDCALPSQVVFFKALSWILDIRGLVQWVGTSTSRSSPETHEPSQSWLLWIGLMCFCKGWADHSTWQCPGPAQPSAAPCKVSPLSWAAADHRMAE